MTAQDLKNSILQLAMQGKLVPQDPNEEPASELLKRIKTEKARLVKEGTIKKGKSPVPVTEEERPFEIPESWEWVRLSQIVYNFGQKIPDEEFCYIDVGSIDNNAGRLSETNTLIKPENAPSRARKVVSCGAILYSCVRPYLLNTCIVDREFPRPPIASTAFAVLMPYEGIYNKYLHLYLRGPSFVSYTNITSTGQAYPAINDQRLYDAVIPVPPFEEQKRIVEKIEQLLPLVEKYDKSERRLLELNKKFPDDLRKAILQQAVQGKLTEQDPHDEPASELLKRIKAEKARLIKEGKIKKEKPLPPISEDEIPFDIPENWVWVRLKEIAKKITDGTHHSPPNMQTGDYMYVTAKNIKDYGVELQNITYVTEETHNEIFSRCNAEFGDVLLIKDGATAGIATVNNIVEPFSMLSSVALIKLCDGVLPKYVVWVFRSNLFYANLRSSMKGAAITRVTLNQIEPMLMPLPPLAEQKRIVARVEALNPLCDSLKNSC